MHKKYFWLLLLGLQGLVACREEKKEPDLAQALVGDYRGGYTYREWSGLWGLTRPGEVKPCEPRVYKVDNNTIGIEITLLDRPLVLEADVSLENQEYRLVVQPAQLTDRTVAGISEYGQPGYHGTFDPAGNLLKLNLLETVQAKEYLAEVVISKQ
jgi:hypothetical protein